jgi:hypothetical protein
MPVIPAILETQEGGSWSKAMIYKKYETLSDDVLN